MLSLRNTNTTLALDDALIYLTEKRGPKHRYKCEKEDKDNRQIEDQALYTSPRFEYRSCATSTKGTAKTGTAYL